MKKLLGIIFLSLMLNGNALSEEIIIKCKSALYKYVDDGIEVKTYSSNIKRDDGKWHQWPYLEVRDDNKHFLDSTDEEKILGEYAVTSKFKKIVTVNGIATNGQSAINFKKRTRKVKGTWQGKPYKANEKCKLVKS
tara:strand:+ start:30 stop:437 length:408 start_codon:yes stop_codon:yes gene_type:complete